MGTQISPSLFWLVNGSTVATYAHRVNDNSPFPRPMTIIRPLDGVMAEVTSATTNPNVTNTIDVTSVLSVSDVLVLNGISLQCETSAGSARFSNVLNVEVDNCLSKLFKICIV